MEPTTRALMFACCVFVVPASAELNLDMVEVDEGAPLEARPELGVKIRSGGGQGGKPMHWMAFNGDEAGIRRLIISGADIDDRLKTGGTPLHLAAYNGHVGVVRLLVEHGAPVNARTKAGVTPLDWARQNGHEEVAKLLIAYGAKVSKTRSAKSATVAGPSGGGKDTGPAFAPRRQIPLKYSLFLVPEDSVVVNRGMKEKAPVQEKAPVKEKVPAQEKAPVRERKKAGSPVREKRPAPEGAYRIQLGAFSSEQRAQDAWTLYRKKYPELLGSRSLILDTASVKGKSYYRVQTGPLSRSDAWGICDRLKQAGQACAVMTRGAS